MQMSLNLMFGVEDSHAKIYRWREQGLAMGLTGNDLDSFTDSLTYLVELYHPLLFSKTYQVYSLQTEDEILESSFKRWPNSGMVWDGVCLTADISESPSHVNESTLLDVIVIQDVPLKYFLSPNAARGILRRVENQGRKLFPPLWKALTLLAEKE
ncbi:hypothetical protein GCM10028810_29780 [Spirosoma litoris]